MRKEISGEISQSRHISDNIQGWLTANEGAFLYKTAKNCTGKGVIVEIGSWKGRSTVSIAKGVKKGKTKDVTIYAIDPHTGGMEEHNIILYTFYEFKNNIREAGVEDIIVPVVKKSDEAARDWKLPIEMIFIDGSHEYDQVEKDFLTWLPFVVEGGTIALHDTMSLVRRGPRKVVRKHILNNKELGCFGNADSIFYTKKGVTCKNDGLARLMFNLKALSLDILHGIYFPVKKLLSVLGIDIDNVCYTVQSPWANIETFSWPARFIIRALRTLKYSGYVEKSEQGVEGIP